MNIKAKAREGGKRMRSKINMRTHPMHPTWKGMLDRCEAKKGLSYPYYGAKGIKVCQRWKGVQGFKNFLLDMGEKPSPFHSIDRIDNTQGYSPENCRWATAKEQALNTARVKPLTINGITQSLNQWAAEIGVCRGTLRYRLAKGLKGEALLRPRADNRKGGS